MARLAGLEPEDMNDEQRAVAESIAAGPRGSVRGPFKMLLHSPELADCVQQTGAYVRYNCDVPWKLRELAILITAKHWASQYEWFAHEKEARKAGLDDAIIDAVRTGKTPEFTDDAEREIWQFCTELYADRCISEGAYAAVVARLGEKATVDLAGLLGHYNLIALTLNIFDVETPDGSMPVAE
jgi:4-carboxymuconolactone decarboxylase